MSPNRPTMIVLRPPLESALHDRMAEARIAYGGRGELPEGNPTRWGQQLMDILLPF